MRKRGLLAASLLLFLSSGLLARAPSGFPEKAPGQAQPQRVEFYALGVVCEKNVQNAKYSMGAPDGRYAEILPGGRLIVLLENKLCPFPIISWNPEGGGAMADSGSVVGKAGLDIGLEGWCPWQDTQGKQHYDWMILGVSATGFILPPTCSFEGSPGVDMIRITNPGTESLFVDAVIGYTGELKEGRGQQSPLPPPPRFETSKE